MWGIVPSVSVASSLPPLAFSRELLPLDGGPGGSRARPGDGRDGAGRPRVLGEHLVERLAAGGVTRLCFVVAPGKSDLVTHFGAEAGGLPVAYVVQPRPEGICDAVFRALPLLGPEDQAVVAPATALWFPERALCRLRDGGLSFLCFPVTDPERHEAVVAAEDGEVRSIRVAERDPGTRWIWGAFKLDGATLRALSDLYRDRGRVDRSFGTLVNAWIARGGTAHAVRAGEIYVDVGSAEGHREALELLGRKGG
jgi:dTDP-glucose pyrophosphorylase